MSWIAFGVLRLTVAGAALATMGLDLDWLWVRLPAVALALVSWTLVTRKLRADRRDRALLIRALTQFRNEAGRSSPRAGR